MPNPFKKVFHGKKDKKKKPVVDKKNQIFTAKAAAGSRPPSQRPPSTAPQPSPQAESEGSGSRSKIIGESFMGNGVGGMGVASNYPPRNPYQGASPPASALPHQPVRPSPSSRGSDSDVSSESDKKRKKKLKASDLLRAPRPADTSLAEGLGLFVLRNHSMTALCFGYNIDKFDALRKASVLLFVFLATIYTALATITHEGQTAGIQVGISVLVLPVATWCLKLMLMAVRNPRAPGLIGMLLSFFISLILFILVMWETWTMITEFPTELWNALFLCMENYALNQVLEVPGLLIQYFVAGKCGGCCRPRDDIEEV